VACQWLIFNDAKFAKIRHLDFFDSFGSNFPFFGAFRRPLKIYLLHNKAMRIKNRITYYHWKYSSTTDFTAGFSVAEPAQ